MSLAPILFFRTHARMGYLALVAGLMAGALPGCAAKPYCEAAHEITAEPVATYSACCQPARPACSPPAAPVKLLAVGHGTPGNYPQHTPGQQRLMAMRAAQIDAYRNLAEQVYGFRVWGNTAVSAFATQNDNVRSYVDAFIRGARVVSSVAVADGTVETTVELELAQDFIDALRRQGSIDVRPGASAGCAVAACAISSAHYVSP